MLPHNNMVDGFSKNLRNSASHLAPTAPSTTLWSQLNVTDIIVASENLKSLKGRQSNHTCHDYFTYYCSVKTRVLSGSWKCFSDFVNWLWMKTWPVDIDSIVQLVKTKLLILYSANVTIVVLSLILLWLHVMPFRWQF